MKQFFLIAALVFLTVTCKAQYIPYNTYQYAQATVDAIDTYRLNNIRFDENALRENPDVWNRYMNYVRTNNYYVKRATTYGIIGLTGIGVVCISLIPLYTQCNNWEAWTIGLMSAGGIAGIVGSIGLSVQLNKVKINKKEFIYYLKTANNGIGIVTMF